MFFESDLLHDSASGVLLFEKSGLRIGSLAIFRAADPWRCRRSHRRNALFVRSIFPLE
jgi:hypothetical protein